MGFWKLIPVRKTQQIHHTPKVKEASLLCTVKWGYGFIIYSLFLEGSSLRLQSFGRRKLWLILSTYINIWTETTDRVTIPLSLTQDSTSYTHGSENWKSWHGCDHIKYIPLLRTSSDTPKMKSAKFHISNKLKHMSKLTFNGDREGGSKRKRWDMYMMSWNICIATGR